MRDIKFRAWDNGRKKMIYQDKHTTFHIADGFVGIDCDETKDYDYREWSWIGSVGCNLMQFTGLKDKNGNDIYEGDIVIHHCDSYDNDFYAVFKWNDVNKRIDLFVFEAVGYWEELDDSVCDMVVVGNKFENPELIKEVLE